MLVGSSSAEANVLRGYPALPSVTAGTTLRFHAASDAGTVSFQVHFYRYGAATVYTGSSGLLTAYGASEGPFNADWSWPAYDVPAPSAPGVYLGLLSSVLTTLVGFVDPMDPALAPSTFLFVVRSATPGAEACILYKLPLFTYQAYNDVGSPGGSLYTGTGFKVTLHRPGGGAGGHAWDDVYPDVYDGGSARQTFAHWDAPFIRWLEAEGYAVEYCTDLDLHQDTGAFLNAYRLLLSVGHDEYWSTELRSRVETFIGNGGNVAFFSGNTCWWRVHLVDNDTAFTCTKQPGPGFDQWFATRPENSLTGVSYRNAGGWWSGPRESLGYTVQYATHWLYDGTGLADGDVFGDADALIGYECDGAQLSPSTGPNGYEVVTAADGTPADFLVLGVAHLGAQWQDWLAGPASAATMGLYHNHGIVFTAATTDWARVLAAGDANVVQITRNVLDRLCSRSIRIRGPFTGLCIMVVGEGMKARFTADTSTLSDQNGLTFAWSVTAGQPGPLDQPTLDLVMPLSTAPVTITVRIQDGTDCSAFGTLTVVPRTADEMARVEIICRLRQFLASIAQHRKAVVGIGGKGGPWFVDPLWDPPPDELRDLLRDRDQLAYLERSALQLAKMLERLREGMGEEG
ncbi:MAG: N,N-dimethylformamidase beta subunit family domain-containing protein [Gemmatimonadota bacterium]